MCGQYTLYTDRENQELQQILEELRKERPGGELRMEGDVFPNQAAPVLVEGEEGPKPRVLTWGFPSFRGKGVLFNGRSETILEKPLFRQAALSRRCLVPAMGFYEWSQNKERHLYGDGSMGLLYMAGLWSRFGGEDRFVILTRPADALVGLVHPRMPVLVRREDRESWLKEATSIPRVLDAVARGLIQRDFGRWKE